jgi:hypothetical protein
MIAAELHIAQLQRLLSVPEHEKAVKSIVGPWAEKNFEKCARVLARFPILHVEPIMGALLGEAVMSFTPDLIIRLVDLNLFAAVPTKDVPHLNVWTYAVEVNRLDVVRTLWSARETYAIDTNALTQALSHASRETYRSEMIAWLIEAGANISAVAAEERFKYVHPLTFALHDALNVGTEQTVRALLKLGADPNHRDSEGGVPLVWAACYGDVSKVRALLSHGAFAPDETEDADFWEALELAPEDCVEEIRRSCRSRELGQMVAAVLANEPDSSGGKPGGPGPL